MNGRFEVVIPDTSEHFLKRFQGCVTGGRSREVCLCMCNFGFCSMYNEMEPSWEGTLSKSLSFGNDCCEWTITRSNHIISDAMLEDYRRFYQNQLPSPIPKELGDALKHEYLGEFWTISTRAFIDYSAEQASERLNSRMRHSGISFGIRLAEHFDHHEVGLDVIGDIVGLVNDLHRRKWTMTRGDGTLEGSVKECPFAHSALPEMCQQYAPSSTASARSSTPPTSSSTTA